MNVIADLCAIPMGTGVSVSRWKSDGHVCLILCAESGREPDAAGPIGYRSNARDAL
jgi:hypothetical protein